MLTTSSTSEVTQHVCYISGPDLVVFRLKVDIYTLFTVTVV